MKKESYQKAKEREYRRKWANAHKEHLREYREKNKEYFAKLRREYYKTHKEKIQKSQKEYRKKNREKFNKIVHDYRKRKALEFEAAGQMYCYLPKTERQNKMVKIFCKKTALDETKARKLLEDNNWNIKKLLGGK